MSIRRNKPLPRLLLAFGLLAPGAGEASQTDVGDVLSYALPAGTLAAELWRGDRAGAAQFARSFAVTLAATEILKRSTDVERPDRSNRASFPSGHASRAFAAATYLHRRHGFDEAWPLYLLSTYVGYTRVQAQRHRWADVAGSAAVAAASSWYLVQPAPGLSVSLGERSVAVYWHLPLP